MTTQPHDSAQTAARKWSDALELFAAHQRHRNLSPGTIAKRVEHVKHFASATTLGPWAVQYDDVVHWLDARRTAGWSENTLRVHRSSLAAFYRWAVIARHTTTNPTQELRRRAEYQAPPDAWVEPLEDYTRYLLGVGRTRTTAETRANAMRRFARENPGLGPWEVRFDDLVSWLGGKRWATETRKLHRDAMRSFYKWAEDSGRCAPNPATKIPPIKGKAPAPRPATDEAYQRALALADSRERLALRLAAELGLRRGEVVQVHSSDLLRDGDDWSLVVHGKGAKDRIIPLPFSIANSLRVLPEGYAFPSVNGHMTAAWMGRIISRLLPPGVSMHALRHRFATRAYEIDSDVLTVQQLLGHASPATTQRYVLVADQTKRRLMDHLARA